MAEISNFVKNVHLLELPSPLWAVHMDPQQRFIAILHVNVNSDKITVDKGVLVTTDDGNLKTTVSLNDEIVQMSSVTSKIETVSDLSALVYSLHDIKVCLNSNSEIVRCSKYVLSDQSDLCDYCAFEVFSDNRVKDEFELPTYVDTNFEDEAVEESVKQEQESKCLCTVCGKTFTTTYSLDNHMLTHVDSKPFKCNDCGKAFAKKYNLNVHSRVHSGERPYVCSKCGKTYSTRSNLSTHLNSTHKEEKKHKCDLCEMSFVHPRMLRIHMRKHTGEKPFMCQTCGKVFSKNIHLTIHTRTHTGEKPYVCSTCGKGFTTSGNLNSHRKINHKV